MSAYVGMYAGMYVGICRHSRYMSAWSVYVGMYVGVCRHTLVMEKSSIVYWIPPPPLVYTYRDSFSQEPLAKIQIYRFPIAP